MVEIISVLIWASLLTILATVIIFSLMLFKAIFERNKIYNYKKEFLHVPHVDSKIDKEITVGNKIITEIPLSISQLQKFIRKYSIDSLPTIYEEDKEIDDDELDCNELQEPTHVISM